MTKRMKVVALALAGCILAPSMALAHTGVGSATGFWHGFEHPITGLDHILAMVTVGILAYQVGGRALWLAPAAFVAVMTVGGLLGIAGIDLPLVELGIALSVVVLGMVVALGVKLPLAAATALVGFFAIFHGHAHGAEIPDSAGGIGYIIGFVMATASLHLVGIGLGSATGRAAGQYRSVVMQSVGGLVTVVGVGILTGLL